MSKLPYRFIVNGEELNIEIVVNTQADVRLAEDIIKYVIDKIREQWPADTPDQKEPENGPLINRAYTGRTSLIPNENNFIGVSPE